jgi:hypothetical protein
MIPMNIIQTSTEVVCPFCEGTAFTSELKGLVFKTTRFVCAKCSSVLETKDGETFTVSTVGDAYSNTITVMKDRKLTRDKLSEPGLPLVSDADLASVSMGEGELFARIINEADQNVPIILKQNEQAIFLLQNTSLSEERIQRTSSGSGAFSFRVAKGVWFHTGRLSQPEYASTLQVIDSGSLVITNKRYGFVGNNKSVDQSLSKIIAIKPFNDGMGIVRSNKQKVEYYKGSYHWPLIASIFMGVVKKYL